MAAGAPPAKRRRAAAGEAEGLLWHYEAVARCRHWWDGEWTGDPAMRAWFWGDIKTCHTISTVRECQRRDGESRRKVCEVDDGLTREIDVATECAHLRSGGLRAGEQAFLRMLCRRRLPRLHHPARAALAQLAGFPVSDDCGPALRTVDVPPAGGPPRPPSPSSSSSDAPGPAPAPGPGPHPLAGLMDHRFLSDRPTAGCESLDDLLADLDEDMHIVVRTNTYACRLTVLPRHSLWDVLHMVRSSTDRRNDMRALVVAHRGHCYDGRDLRRTLESAGVAEGDTLVVLPTNRCPAVLDRTPQPPTSLYAATDEVEWHVLDVDFFGGLLPDAVPMLAKRCRRATAVVRDRLVYLFGQVLLSPDPPAEELPSLCVLDLATGAVTGMATGGAAAPGPLRGHAAVLWARRHMVVVGGVWAVPLARGPAVRTWPWPTVLPLQGMVQDVYSLDLDTLTWSVFRRDGWQPGPMFQHTAVAGPGDAVFVFGGCGLPEVTAPVGECIWGDTSLFGTDGNVHPCNALHVLLPREQAWEDLTVQCLGPLPPSRHSHAAAVWGGTLFVFGGLGENSAPLADLHALDLASLVWRPVAVPGLPRGVQALGASGPGGASLALLDVDALHPEDPPLWQLRLDSPSLRQYHSPQRTSGEPQETVVFMDFHHFYRLHMADNYLLCVCEMEAPPWSPATHHLFPRWFRAAVRTLLLLTARTDLCPLPALWLAFGFLRVPHGAWPGRRPRTPAR